MKNNLITRNFYGIIQKSKNSAPQKSKKGESGRNLDDFINVTLFEFQKNGIEWMIKREKGEIQSETKIMKPF